MFHQKSLRLQENARSADCPFMCKP